MAKKKTSRRASAAKTKTAKKKTATKRTSKTKAPAKKKVNHDERMDPAFKSLINVVRKETEHDIYVASDTGAFSVGIPLPSLALKYLFQSTVWLLSRVSQLVGSEGSCKSSFLYEIIRWHYIYHGYGALIENETKDSPELRASIFQHNTQWLDNFGWDQTGSINEWQAAMGSWVKTVADQAEKDGGMNCFCVGLDSVTAKSTEETQKKIEKEGSAGRGHPLEAMSITRFMQGRAISRMSGVPISIVGVNHLKPSTDFMGRPVRNIAGGKHIKFQESLEVELHRICDYDRVEDGGIRIGMKCHKNSCGQSRRKIEVDFLWWWEQHGEEWRQISAWDWWSASIELLLSFEAKKTIFKQLMAIVDINVAGRGTKKVWSKKLGIKKENPVSYRAAGELLEQRPDLLDEIYPILRISKRHAFTGEKPYTEVVQDAMDKAEKADREALFTPSQIGAEAGMLQSAQEVLGPDQEVPAEDYDGDTL
jgi:hypothetical protein